MNSLPADIFVELPGQLTPRETPFDTPGTPPRRCRFIWRTNATKGRFSTLLPFDYDFATLGWGLAEYFPMGYTNLEHLEKIRAFHPDPTKLYDRTDKRWEVRPYQPKERGARPEEGALYSVFRAPIKTAWTGDVIGLSFNQKRATAMAERYTATYGRPSLVALLIKRITWH